MAVVKTKGMYDVERKWLFQQVAIALVTTGRWSPEIAKKITNEIMEAAEQVAKGGK